jgi:DNA replication protein DnaC
MIEERKFPKAGCNKCKDGYIRIPKKDFGIKYEICECLVERENLVMANINYRNSNMPQPKIHFRFEDWVPPKGVEFEFLDSFAEGTSKVKWLYIMGTAGTGKTFLATIIARLALLKEKRVYFTGVTELLDNLRPDNDEKALVLKRCKEYDLLVLDDIGHEKSSEWVRERLYLIINHRWQEGKATIFTSNFDIESMKERIPPAVYSRVKGFSFEIKLQSKDRRIS